MFFTLRLDRAVRTAQIKVGVFKASKINMTVGASPRSWRLKFSAAQSNAPSNHKIRWTDRVGPTNTAIAELPGSKTSTTYCPRLSEMLFLLMKISKSTPRRGSRAAAMGAGCAGRVEFWSFIKLAPEAVGTIRADVFQARGQFPGSVAAVQRQRPVKPGRAHVRAVSCWWEVDASGILSGKWAANWSRAWCHVL